MPPVPTRMHVVRGVTKDHPACCCCLPCQAARPVAAASIGGARPGTTGTTTTTGMTGTSSTSGTTGTNLLYGQY